jgi:hypothetical protein
MFATKFLKLPLLGRRKSTDRVAQGALPTPYGTAAGPTGLFTEKRSRNASLHRDAMLALSGNKAPRRTQWI